MPPRPPDSAPAIETATESVRRAPDSPRPIGAILRCKGVTPFRFEAGRRAIGSGHGCDWLIAAKGISRRHVELELVPEGVRVQDLGSRNGTFYLGQRIESATLTLGATLVLGTTEIFVDADTESLDVGAFAGSEFRGMVGVSAAMRKVFALLFRLEGSLAPVLIGGESGVGKELIAHAIHAGSPVADGPLVVVNCGAIARDLVASELFGHKKGAFTGAADARRGAFECADGGTLFLDEIGELPVDIQPMLLRVLESGDVRPVGGDAGRKVKVRTLSATNRRLYEEVGAGRFREDLYYRLAVVKIEVPPLRDRVEDILPLAMRFAEQHAVRLPAPAIEKLKAHRWPGNVRELRNAVQAFAALGTLPEPSAPNAAALHAFLADLVDFGKPYQDQKEALGDVFARAYMQKLLAKTGGNQTVAAKLAGMDRTYLGRLLARLGLTRG